MEAGNEWWKFSVSLTVRAVCKGKVYANMSHSEWQLGNEYRKLCKREQIGYLRETPCRNDSEIKTETSLLQHLCDKKKKCGSVWLKSSVGSGYTDLKCSNW